ncbi:haloacid dehalogenase-like hydrolase [Natranaerovirga hydrolytica]|uniref:Haloacid dehalogenase-like hydrolase n=1 Tax=Natranaerovirga hydrolytica TaxID=680378 RepID=A0A4R1MMI8_9FIRM|nr:HAD hydrolase-like protein [Natranaerovirga hydrolytica]TCK92494.1 haloacid dehalogenase-like hydrolase [Natranaerovirga hydrolytica]
MKDKFLVCIDSDGCAIDSMTVKHEKAFGPAFVEIWKISDFQKKTVLNEWNNINLYSITRGINRFQGLLAILNLHPELVDGEQLSMFKVWTETTKALSAESLKEEYKQTGLEIMDKALKWSDLVNSKMEELPLAQPFDGVIETVQEIKLKADIAVVSSANLSAIKEEWQKCGLYQLVDYFYSQSDGTKSECINRLISTGYHRNKIIMIGDALGDFKAAETNQVWFFPILAAKESMSWLDLKQKYLNRFFNQQFNKTIQEKLFLNMKDNLL